MKKDPGTDAAANDTPAATYGVLPGANSSAGQDSEKEVIAYSTEEMAWGTEGGKQTLWVMNRTLNDIAFKVRCSNNKAFWIQPVFGVIESSGAAEINVNRNANVPIKNDKIVVCCAKYTIKDGALEAFFKRPTTITEDKEIHQIAAAPNAEQQGNVLAQNESQLTMMKC
ncbi:hypothetical protein Y032_0081g1457 [Ancylostoma ceylanicum]|uniref:Major sperm protein n=1 Tax=Ancylostoma ceylanicum TaxID=53326 RepID=A0A016TSJ1_9BILA|nr:hypothetical protein Y032_0081g1457 [Ancylostoma ceylanicum]